MIFGSRLAVPACAAALLLALVPQTAEAKFEEQVQECHQSCVQVAASCTSGIAGEVLFNPHRQTDSAQCILAPMGLATNAEFFRFHGAGTMPKIEIEVPRHNEQVRPGLIVFLLQMGGLELGHFEDPETTNTFLMRSPELGRGLKDLELIKSFVRLTNQFLYPSGYHEGSDQFEFPEPEELESFTLSKGAKNIFPLPNFYWMSELRMVIRVTKPGWHRICAEALSPTGRTLPMLDPDFTPPLDCIRIEVVDRITRDNDAPSFKARVVKDQAAAITKQLRKGPADHLV